MSNDTSRLNSSASYDRKLRYRALLEDLSTLEDEVGNNDVCLERTSTVVNEVKALLSQGGVDERVRHPGEGYLDSRVLRASSDLVVRCSEAVSGNANLYDKHELAAHIKENPNFWELQFPLEVPVVGYLFGTFAPTPPEQRPRAPKKRIERQKNNVELRAPQNVDKTEQTEEGTVMVRQVRNFIKSTYRTKAVPLSYFHLVLDPDSFSRTVENIYYISFLVKDGYISVQLDEEHGLPFVCPVRDKERAAGAEEDEQQFVVSIDMAMWQELVEAFGIKKPMMVLDRL